MSTIIYTYQKSKKKKPNAKQRELAAEWESLLKKWEPKHSIAKVMKNDKLTQVGPVVPPGRNTRHIASLNTGLANATMKPPQVYTGDNMIGIGQMHKSNAVPIFRQEDAKDLATMRR